MSWQPVLDGEIEAQARSTLNAIVDELLASDDTSDVSLAHGRSGNALLLAQLAQDPHDAVLADRAAAQLAAAAATAALSPLSFGLYAGFTGIAWATEQLQRLGMSAASDANAQIDVRLLTALERSPWRGHHDLATGLVGVGVYLLERMDRVDRPIARTSLEQLVTRLEENATCDASGIRWHTAPTLLSSEARAGHPRGYYDLGLAHGIPGVIALLGKLCRANVARAQCERLLEGAVPWLLAQSIGGEASFPCFVEPEVTPEPGPTGWRYGDPGVAAALLIAARGTGEARWEEQAVRIALTSCKRAVEHTGVVDAGIAQGAAGLAHIYGRFFQVTGEGVFRDAARRWFARALSMRTPAAADGLAGYLAWRPNVHGTPEWTHDRTLLSGVIGIALCLHAGISCVEPSWDRLLLLDLPTR